MKSPRIFVFALSICLLFVSCDIMKQSAKTKTSTDLKETVETHTYRKGDTVRYKIPKITFKDTTVYTTNRQGTTLQTIYDKQGNVSDINCYASQIEELSRRNTELSQDLKEKQKEKTEKANLDWVLYLVGGVVVLGIIALFLFYKMMQSNLAPIKELMNQSL